MRNMKKIDKCIILCSKEEKKKMALESELQGEKQ